MTDTREELLARRAIALRSYQDADGDEQLHAATRELDAINLALRELPLPARPERAPDHRRRRFTRTRRDGRAAAAGDA